MGRKQRQLRPNPVVALRKIFSFGMQNVDYHIGGIRSIKSPRLYLYRRKSCRLYKMILYCSAKAQMFENGDNIRQIVGSNVAKVTLLTQCHGKGIRNFKKERKLLNHLSFNTTRVQHRKVNVDIGLL